MALGLSFAACIACIAGHDDAGNEMYLRATWWHRDGAGCVKSTDDCTYE